MMEIEKFTCFNSFGKLFHLKNMKTDIIRTFRFCFRVLIFLLWRTLHDVSFRWSYDDDYFDQDGGWWVLPLQLVVDNIDVVVQFI